MQLAASGHETELMYKEISFRSVPKPGRISAPGFVIGAGGWGLCIGSGPDEGAPGQMQASIAFPRFESYRRTYQPRPQERARHPEARVPYWGARLEGLRASRRRQKCDRASGHPCAKRADVCSEWVTKVRAVAALERYDAARKARCILMTAFSTFRGGAEQPLCNCYVPVWGAAEFCFLSARPNR